MPPKTVTLPVALAAAAVLAALAAPPARAEIDAKCLNEWNGALITIALGEKCKYIDAATTDKIRKAQDGRMQCAKAKATPAEQGELAKTVAAAQADSVSRVAQMQCAADVRKAYDAQVTNLAK
jgi:hypothetical protein